MGLFGASEDVTSPKLNSMSDYVLKTADESVTSSATLQNDDHLVYALPATGTYLFKVNLFAVSAANAAGDIRVGFSFPTGTCHFRGVGPHNTLASGSQSDGEWAGVIGATSGTDFIPYGLSVVSGVYHIGIKLEGILIATATGNLRVMWAQYASNASATTVKAGSHMQINRVA